MSEDAPKEKGRKRRALFGVVLLFLGTVFTVGSSEIVLRFVLPFRYFNFTSAAYPADEYHPRYGWSGIPDLDKPFTVVESRIRIQTNADGYRDAPFAEPLRSQLRFCGRRRFGSSIFWRTVRSHHRLRS